MPWLVADGAVVASGLHQDESLQPLARGISLPGPFPWGEAHEARRGLDERAQLASRQSHTHLRRLSYTHTGLRRAAACIWRRTASLNPTRRTRTSGASTFSSTSSPTSASSITSTPKAL